MHSLQHHGSSEVRVVFRPAHPTGPARLRGPPRPTLSSRSTQIRGQPTIDALATVTKLGGLFFEECDNGTRLRLVSTDGAALTAQRRGDGMTAGDPSPCELRFAIVRAMLFLAATHLVAPA
ncbi:MAG: hypothetical protein ACI8RZ_006663 [Myxococcota bacterium]